MPFVTSPWLVARIVSVEAVLSERLSKRGKSRRMVFPVSREMHSKRVIITVHEQSDLN